MSPRRDSIRYALKPFQYLFIFSTTASSLGSNDLLVSSMWYRIYLISFSTVSTLFLLYAVSNEGTVTISPFNITSVYLNYWVVQFFMLISPLVNAKKMRVQKILQALEDLDMKIRFRYSEVVEKNRLTVIASICTALVYHVIAHVLIVTLLTVSRVDAYIVTLTFWFKILEISIDIELICLGSFILLLCRRCEYFISHLNDRLGKRVDDTDLNIMLLCHRQLHYVLKKINKAFRVKITIIVYFVTILSLRNLVLVLTYYEENLLIYSALILVSRYILLLALLGAIGQRVTNTFDRIHLLVTDMRISSQINSDLCRRVADMCVEGELRGKRLCSCNGLQVDAKLPLRVLSAIGTILVFIFSINIDIKSI